MMQNWIIVAAIAALASAIGYLGISVLPGALTFSLFYLASLPLYVVGLGWGVVAAAAAAAMAALAIALFNGPLVAGFYVISAVLAPVILTHLALQNRQSSPGKAEEGEVQSKGVEWYPEGRLVLWASAISAAIVTLTVLVTGPDAATFSKKLTELVGVMSQANLEQLSANQREQFDVMMQSGIRFFPVIAPAIWLLIALANLGLAIKLVGALGLSPRPWTAFGRLQFPRPAGLLLTGAVVLSFLPGTLGYIGAILCGAFFTAFSILGLAVLHGLLTGHSLRGFLLFALYFSLFLLNAFLVVPLVFVALLDLMLGMRKKIFGTSGPGGGSVSQ